MTLAVSLTPAAEFDAVTDASNLTVVHANLILDSSYPSGGYPVTPSRFGLGSRIVDVVTTNVAIRKNNFATNFDPVNKTVRVFSIPSSGAWTEVTATTNLSGFVIKAVVIGY